MGTKFLWVLRDGKKIEMAKGEGHIWPQHQEKDKGTPHLR